MFPVE